MIPLHNGKPLPKRKREFIKEFVRLGDEYEAYLLVGYAPARGARYKAKKLRDELAREIEAAFAEHLVSVDTAVIAAKQLRYLAENAESESVMFQAAKELLSRGGWDTPKEVNINHNVKHLSNDELDNRIKEVTQDLRLVSIQ